MFKWQNTKVHILKYCFQHTRINYFEVKLRRKILERFKIKKNYGNVWYGSSLRALDKINKSISNWVLLGSGQNYMTWCLRSEICLHLVVIFTFTCSEEIRHAGALLFGFGGELPVPGLDTVLLHGHGSLHLYMTGFKHSNRIKGPRLHSWVCCS